MCRQAITNSLHSYGIHIMHGVVIELSVVELSVVRAQVWVEISVVQHGSAPHKAFEFNSPNLKNQEVAKQGDCSRSVVR